jgi:hypothetical protein
VNINERSVVVPVTSIEPLPGIRNPLDPRNPFTYSVPPRVISIVPELVADNPKVTVPDVPESVRTDPALNLSVPGPAEPPPAPNEIVFATALLMSTVTVALFLTIMPSTAKGKGEIVLQFVSAMIVILRALA